jgi:DNA-binding MarR family transcriptional regulator/N-acetylglutamate synthase-like GNAT family acetyltransferase
MDVLIEPGMVFLGSRLKRLAERFQAGAARILLELDIPVQLSHLPLITALSRQSMTVGELAEAIGAAQPGVTRSVGQLIDQGLVQSSPGADRRERHLELTSVGRALMETAKTELFPRVQAAMEELCAPLSSGFENGLAQLEVRLAREPLDKRIMRDRAPLLRLIDYNDAHAANFREVNLEWIESMFVIEPRDRDVLENPRERIINAGGVILLAEHATLGVIGTGALEHSGQGIFELTKMAVREKARGLKAGELLLKGLIQRAAMMGAREVFLLSNRKCAAAVHLYEKAGFVHDAEIMREHGADYVRCDVAMRYRIDGRDI